MASPPMKSRTAVKALTLDEGLQRLATMIKGASLEALAGDATSHIAKFLGAASIRLFFKDALTEELYARYQEGARVREIRVPQDPSSVVGYAAMTRSKSFAWKTASGTDKRYVTAAPLAVGGDVLGVLELTHGMPNAPVDEERLRVFNELAGHMARRLQGLLKVTVRATPYDLLLNSGALTAEGLKKARELSAQTGTSVERILVSQQGINKEALGRSLSEHFQCPFVPVPVSLSVSNDLIVRFAPSFLETHAVLPIARTRDSVQVLVVNPRNLALCDDIARQSGADKVTVSVAIREDILEALKKFVVHTAPTSKVTVMEGGAAAATAQKSLDFEKVESGEGSYDLGDKEVVEVDSASIRLVNEAIQAAVDGGASDIHWEPTLTGGLTIRFRIDGVLQDYRLIREQCAKPVVSRIKIMARLDIAEHRLPQDGKIRLKDKSGSKVDLRVAVVPTSAGYEDVVLRLLPDTQAMPIEQLGMEPENFERFKKVIDQPHGIILSVGPTGSGKTTTLHAALGHLKGPAVKIWTAEDPVEITQEGVRQVQVHPKIELTFERCLRAFLRCDPDIIMIGEIRDRETANAAVEASLTGHLVLSTLHTNSAAETVTRLLEMGLDPFAFGDSLLAVLAQRLVRRVCGSCKEVHNPSNEEWAELGTQYGDTGKFNAMKIDRKKITLAQGKGCAECFNTGYRGRMGIHELLVVSPEIRRLVQARAEAEKIRKQALSQGMTLLKQDGIRKVMKGVTDLKEVQLTCLEENI